MLSGRAPKALVTRQAASLCVRPEQIVLQRVSQPKTGQILLPVTVSARIFLGEQTEYVVQNADLGAFRVLVPRQAEGNEAPFDPGQTTYAAWHDGSGLILSND